MNSVKIVSNRHSTNEYEADRIRAAAPAPVTK